MKSYALIFTLALTLLKPAQADIGMTIDPNTPGDIVRIADGLHVLDNGVPATLYDVGHGVWMAGVITEVYKTHWTSIDLGGTTPLVEGAQAEFLTGARFHAGEFAMDVIPGVNEFMNDHGLRDGLIKYATGGLFYSRDWSAHENRWGPYVGVEFRIY